MQIQGTKHKYMLLIWLQDVELYLYVNVRRQGIFFWKYSTFFMGIIIYTACHYVSVKRND